MARQEIRGETFVFPGTEPQRMRFHPLAEGGVRLRSRMEPSHPDNVAFTEGDDFVVDYERGTISRTASSRLPDWTGHPLYGSSGFDHREYSDISNAPFTVYADYDSLDEAIDVTSCTNLVGLSGGLKGKLETGKPITYVVFGDSISMGAEVPDVRHTFARRFAQLLQKRYPRARIEVRNKAVGGETSGQGLERLEAAVIAERPNLITIGYGMNDQNRTDDGGNAVSPDRFELNLETMIVRLRASGVADIVLLTPCLPNPAWRFASANVTAYADAVRRTAAKHGAALADVQRLWTAELKAGKSNGSLLINHVNHPNEYGHCLYARALGLLLE